MKTKEILRHIKENGGFNNFNNWNRQEIIIWIKTSYNCSSSVANKVYYYI